MQYKQFGKLAIEVSRFGVGAMRLPVHSREKGLYGPDIDEEEAIKMIRCAVDNGVNYFDTAYAYHGGNSERIVGKAFKGYREKAMVATKLPTWLVEKASDFERLLDEQLAKMGFDYIDFYLLHGLGKDRWRKILELGVLDFLEAMVKKDKIRYTGFSFHDELDVFKEIIDAYDWPMCQIQLNYMDKEVQAGVEGMRYAASKDTAVVIMEPLKGGSLAEQVPAIEAVWEQAPVKRSPAAWAFRWLIGQPEVTLVLSGVSTMEQLKDNIRIFSEVPNEPLSVEEQKLFEEVADTYRLRIKVECTTCNYCTPCPSGVNIPELFKIYNNLEMYGNDELWLEEYDKWFINKGSSALECTECGECEEKCPQKIKIIEQLKKAHARLTAAWPFS